MSRLLKATFDCEVITPMFLAGANQDKPEIRAASMRGQIRWWFRAIYGGMNGGNKRDCLKKETALFGGTQGDKAGQAKVWIKLNNDFHHSHKKKIKPIPHKSFQFKAIPKNTRFTVELRSKSKFEEEHRCIESLFKLSSILGGLGRRSRRGFGSYQVLSDTYHNREGVELTLIETIQNLLKQVKKIAKIENKLLPPGDISPWPIISNNHVKLRIAEPEKWNEFINKLMNKLSNGLSNSHPDPKLHPNVLGNIKYGRQASTMLVSVVRLESGLFVPIFCQFFCDTKTKISLKKSHFDNLSSFPKRIFDAQEIDL